MRRLEIRYAVVLKIDKPSIFWYHVFLTLEYLYGLFNQIVNCSQDTKEIKGIRRQHLSVTGEFQLR